MNEHNNVFTKAILAGIFIAIAALIFLSIENRIIGAVWFSFGLLVIVAYKYYLYTGLVSYALPHKRGYPSVLAISLLGNFVGVLIIGLLFRFSGITAVIQDANSLFMFKISKPWYETFVLSMFCGMMVYTAVQSYRIVTNEILKVVLVIFSISIFIIAGFEHSIANMTFLVVGNAWSLKAILYIFIMVIGNSVGAVALNLLNFYALKDKNEHMSNKNN